MSKDIIIALKFQTQLSTLFGKTREEQNQKCKRACEHMIKTAGFSTPSTSAGSINVAAMDQKRNLVLLATAKQGYARLDEQLAAGKPTCVAVDRGITKDANNANKASDHFVVIYGCKTGADGKTYYLFADPGTTYASKGMSPNNLLSMNDQGFLTGTSAYFGSTLYTLTEVRSTT